MTASILPQDSFLIRAFVRWRPSWARADPSIDPGWRDWRDYCPNATTLSTLSTLQACWPTEGYEQKSR